MRKILAASFLFLGSASSFACGDDTGVGGAGTDTSSASTGKSTSVSSSASATSASSTSSATTASASSVSSSSTGAELEYPPGPYGFEEGDTIPNLTLRGTPHWDQNTARVPFALAELYNPAGDGTYPPSSMFATGPQPRALLLAATARWSPPDTEEFSTLLPMHYDDLVADQVEAIALVAAGKTPGVAGNEVDLVDFGNVHTPSFPIAIEVAPTVDAALIAYPTNFLIDTRTMKIESIVLGVPDPSSTMWQDLADIAAP